MDYSRLSCLFLFIFFFNTVGAADVDTIFFRLYHGSNSSYTDEKMATAGSLVPKMDLSKPTVLYIHGFSVNVEHRSVLTVVTAYLIRGDHNVLAMDYSQLVNGLYPEAALNCGDSGEAASKGLESMVAAGLDPNKLHLVGHSLGAQVTGFIGRKASFRIPRITGLDPAGPLYNVVLPHLTSKDANYVDIIHSDAGAYGTLDVTGTVNFFPNNGHRPQPNCLLVGAPLSDTDFCSHYRSWRYYAESVVSEHAFPAIKCPSSAEFIAGTCNKSDTAYMGYAAPHAVGSYYLVTRGECPYGMGEKGLKYDL